MGKRPVPRFDRINRANAVRILVLQSVLTFLLALAGLVFLGGETAISLMVGGLLCVSGNAAFAYVAYKRSAARPGPEVLASLYAAEIIKLVFIMMLFYLLFRHVPLFQEKNHAISLFISFILVQQVFWFGPLLCRGPENSKQ